MQINSFTKTALVLTITFLSMTLHAQSKLDSAAVQTIIQDEVVSWNKGDATAYSQHFAEKGTFTNIQGAFFIGHQTFVERHDQIFKTVFNKTVLQVKPVSLMFVRPDVAVVETLSFVSEFAAGPPPGARLDAKGRLCTRLLQVMAKEADGWKIVAYHNVDVKPGVPVPE